MLKEGSERMKHDENSVYGCYAVLADAIGCCERAGRELFMGQTSRDTGWLLILFRPVSTQQPSQIFSKDSTTTDSASVSVHARKARTLS